MRIRNTANHFQELSYNLATQAKDWLTQCTVVTENTYKKVGFALNNAGSGENMALLSPCLSQEGIRGLNFSSCQGPEGKLGLTQ